MESDELQASERLVKIRQLRKTASMLALKFSPSILPLKEGRAIPHELIDEHHRWALDVVNTLSDWGQVSELKPHAPLTPDATLGDWEVALERHLTDIRLQRDQRRTDREKRQSLLAAIQDLRLQGTLSPTLVKVQDSARALLAILRDDARWKEALEAEEMIAFDALWHLVEDARDGRADEPEAVRRSDLVARTFGMQLALQAYSGKLVPDGGWPVVLEMGEAMARLQLGAPIPTPAPPLQPARLVVRPVENRDLDWEILYSVQMRLRERADESSRAAPEPGDGLSSMRAACYQTLADAIELVIFVGRDYLTKRDDEQWRHIFGETLQIMATGQSALRKLSELRGLGEDPDQLQCFRWLRKVSDEQRFYIARHMKRDEPAEPSRVIMLKPRIQEIRAELDAPRRVTKLLRKIDFELSQVTGDREDDRAHWEAVVRAITSLVEEERLPPSNKELREKILPKYAELPEDLLTTPQVLLVVREIDRYLADQESTGQATEVVTEASAEVREVGELLQGKKAILIGGVPRPETRDRLEQALQLGELVWEEAREHEPKAHFESMVNQADVTLVCLMIRWVGHNHVDVIKEFCREAGKLCVIMPRGYGVNQFAHDILQQVGDRLRQEA